VDAAGFSVKGKYFETCNCDVSCPCIWLGPATNDACDVLLAWHVSEGQRDGVDLSGLNAVMAVHTLKQMTDGNWKVALYLDERATPEQSEALGAVFSGGAGGHLAGLGPLIAEVAGVVPAKISFEHDGDSLKATVGDILSMESMEWSEWMARTLRSSLIHCWAPCHSPSRRQRRARSATTTTGTRSSRAQTVL